MPAEVQIISAIDGKNFQSNDNTVTRVVTELESTETSINALNDFTHTDETEQPVFDDASGEVLPPSLVAEARMIVHGDDRRGEGVELLGREPAPQVA